MSQQLVVPGGGPVAGAVAGVAVPVPGQAPPPVQGPEFGKASPIALVVILLLGIATVLLIRSMTTRIRRLPASFDDPPAEDASPEGTHTEDRPAGVPETGSGPTEPDEQVDLSKDRSG